MQRLSGFLSGRNNEGTRREQYMAVDVNECIENIC